MNPPQYPRVLAACPACHQLQRPVLKTPDGNLLPVKSEPCVNPTCKINPLR